MAEETNLWNEFLKFSSRERGHHRWSRNGGGENICLKSIDCGSVGGAVASNTRGSQFESGHRQNFIHLFTIKCIEKTKINKKRRPGMAHFQKIYLFKNTVLRYGNCRLNALMLNPWVRHSWNSATIPMNITLIPTKDTIALGINSNL